MRRPRRRSLMPPLTIEADQPARPSEAIGPGPAPGRGLSLRLSICFR